MATKLLLLDCDSTLSSIEGIDELGRLRGPETFKAVEDMTNAAMDGGTPMEAIFTITCLNRSVNFQMHPL